MRKFCDVVFGVLVLGALAILAPLSVEGKDNSKKNTKDKNKHPKPSTFHGMIGAVSGSNIGIKHANGTGKWFDAAKATITGLATSLQGLKKGQIVTVSHVGNKARKVNVEKQPAASPKLTGKVEHYLGTVDNVQSDQFGDNGTIWVKGAKGVKKFQVHNETTIDYKQAGKKILHTLQGVTKGMKVKVTHRKDQATHIDVIK